jgi:hypothetical protein
VYYGESIWPAIGNGAAQKLAQKSALCWWPVLQIAKDAPEIRGGEAQGIALRARRQRRQVEATCFVTLANLRHMPSEPLRIFLRRCPAISRFAD